MIDGILGKDLHGNPLRAGDKVLVFTHEDFGGQFAWVKRAAGEDKTPLSGRVLVTNPEDFNADTLGFSSWIDPHKLVLYEAAERPVCDHEWIKGNPGIVCVRCGEVEQEDSS